MDASIHGLEDYEQQYQQFIKMCGVKDKELPISEIMDSIEKLLVDEGRHILLKWNME